MSQKKTLPTFTITIQGEKAAEPITGKVVTNNWDRVVGAAGRMLREAAYDGNPATTFIKVVCDRGETYASSLSGLRRTYFDALRGGKGLTLRQFFGNAIRIVAEKYVPECRQIGDIGRTRVTKQYRSIDIGRARFRWFPPEHDDYWLEVDRHAASYLMRLQTKWEKGITDTPDGIIIIYPFSRYILNSIFPYIPEARFSGKSTEEKLIQVYFLKVTYFG